ncbi:MAG: leucine--tRNA ligase [Chloroflexi bacterium]|nr:leucine--tRNA ligase [Chloroflexota bacterium]|tara:strand:+ start:8134 stop:10572 length:2439 start_codon:yes stop_codon:yes gene_type:complete
MVIDKDKEYSPKNIEKKWQNVWKETKLYKTEDYVATKKNWYALSMFPYPSGDLHIGHWFAFTPADAHARFMRLKGYNVLHPQGFDAFGLPAENAAIERNINPKKWTFNNVRNMQSQFDLMGNSYDWDRKLVTCTPEYYQWNQKFFLDMYKKGIAYRKNGPVWWDPIDQTTLANEQVRDGKSERSGGEVIRKMMPQWYFKITDYAEELLDMDSLEWPSKIKQMQTNWVGKSEGVTINFQIENTNKKINTFTTRIDTLFGVTFLVISPEHPIINQLDLTKKNNNLRKYIENANKLSEIDRTSTTRDKTGVLLGVNCINPINSEKVPVFVGDYVLSTYGTGAVMGVPAHDERDFSFAKKYNLPIRVVISEDGSEVNNLDKAYTANGIQINSGEFNGINNIEGQKRITNLIESKKVGEKTITYHLRDWLISRQRYWGTPIPICYDKNENIIPLEESDLPVILPEAKEFMPTGQSPLTLDEKFLYFDHPEYGKLRRETDTMDTFMDSSWYHLKFASPDIQSPFEKEKIDKWSPVDQYMGGAEHAVMHLLYARFFNKVLRDLGYLNFDEPYKRLFNQGVMLARHMKISKRNNPLNPQPLIEKYGTDSVRAYLMFLGPWDKGGDWSDSGINGIHRWLKRLWNLIIEKYEFKHIEESEIKNLEQISNLTTKNVINDMSNFKFNTSISYLMEYTNTLQKIKQKRTISYSTWIEACKRLLIHLSPICPHITEELWNRLGEKGSIHLQNNPTFNEKLIERNDYTLIVQINGKLRDQIKLQVNTSIEEIMENISSSKKISKYLSDKEIIKKIYIENKLLNLVVR